jgi:hypothetical protein
VLSSLSVVSAVAMSFFLFPIPDASPYDAWGSLPLFAARFTQKKAGTCLLLV